MRLAASSADIPSVPYLTDPSDLSSLLGDEPSYRADQLRRWLYLTPVLDIASMTNLPASLRDRLGSLWPFEVEDQQTADEGLTVKWLFRAPDGAAIEAVLMGYRRRMTLCISSQAGCAAGCKFCATAAGGFSQNLAASEIIAQWLHVDADLKSEGLNGVTQIVFM